MRIAEFEFFRSRHLTCSTLISAAETQSFTELNSKYPYFVIFVDKIPFDHGHTEGDGRSVFGLPIIIFLKRDAYFDGVRENHALQSLIGEDRYHEGLKSMKYICNGETHEKSE